MTLRPGLVSVTFRELPVHEIIHIATANKLEGIEWGGDIHVSAGDISKAREVGRRTVDADLEVAAYGSYYRAGESEQAGMRFAAIRDTAAALMAPTIRIWAGAKNVEDASEAYRNQVTEDIVRVGSLAKEAGMTVSLEFHSSTLTNTVASLLKILDATHPGQVRSYWQPPVGMNSKDAMNGLRQISPRLSNIHIFHWGRDGRIRHPLEMGQSCWRKYLGLVQANRNECWALLEFVRNNSASQLTADAKFLLQLLRELDCVGR